MSIIVVKIRNIVWGQLYCNEVREAIKKELVSFKEIFTKSNL